MATLLLFDADVGVTLTFTILNASGTPVDLTNATVTWWWESSRGQRDSMGATVTNPTQGTVTVTVPANTFAPGIYTGQLRVVQGTTTFHTERFPFQVGEALTT